jgi:peptidoglycan hydrolase-like protein with peptidoglycan-binding domain
MILAVPTYNIINTRTKTNTDTHANATKPLYKSHDLNCDPKSATLQAGSKGNKVIELQTYLTDLGYGDLLDPEKIDGKFGPHTKNSVMAYQKDFGLSVDGIVGSQSWKSLCEQVSLLPTTFPTNNIPKKAFSNYIFLGAEKIFSYLEGFH